MADAPQAGVTLVELTDEEKAVLRECRINSVYFRVCLTCCLCDQQLPQFHLCPEMQLTGTLGVPLGALGVVILRQAIKYGVPIPYAKRFPGIYYTGIFGFGFITGIASYQNACLEKIMKLENSRLADQVRARQRSGNRGSYQGQWQTANVGYEQQDVDFQGTSRSSNRFSEPPAQDYNPSNVTAPSSVESSQEAPPPPSLYFDVEKAKEDKYTSYAELRKKHRERWTPPGLSSSGSSRSEQPRHTQGEPGSRASSSDAPLSWFDMDNSSDERNNPDSNREGGQRRPSYRQGAPPRKNKYGDVLE